MDDKLFKQMVAEGIDAIPEKFLKKIKNTAIVIAEKPTRKQLRDNDVPAGSTLLGLYEGIPQIERGDFYGVGETMPDKITIFKRPILEASNDDPSQIREEVKDTVWHEIAHHFGMTEEEVEAREGERDASL